MLVRVRIEEVSSTCLEDESVCELDIASITNWLDAILGADESAKRQSSLLTDEIEGSESHGDGWIDGWLESVDGPWTRVDVGRGWKCSKEVWCAESIDTRNTSCLWTKGRDCVLRGETKSRPSVAYEVI